MHWFRRQPKDRSQLLRELVLSEMRKWPHFRWEYSVGGRRTGDAHGRVFMIGADLSGADLRGLSLAGSDLQKVDFSGALLDGVRFDQCDLRNADFTGACGHAVYFSEADLRDAKFVDATFTKSSFFSSNVARALFVRSDLTDSWIGYLRYAPAVAEDCVGELGTALASAVESQRADGVRGDPDGDDWPAWRKVNSDPWTRRA